MRPKTLGLLRVKKLANIFCAKWFWLDVNCCKGFKSLPIHSVTSGFVNCSYMYHVPKGVVASSFRSCCLKMLLMICCIGRGSFANAGERNSFPCSISRAASEPRGGNGMKISFKIFGRRLPPIILFEKCLWINWKIPNLSKVLFKCSKR